MKRFVEILINEIRKDEEVGRVFQMGSRRFGWWTEDSDWDYCVFTSDQLSTELTLLELGFAKMRPTIYEFPTPGQSLWMWQAMGTVVHVLMLASRELFEAVEAQHMELETALKNQSPEFQKLLRLTRRSGASSGTSNGATFYRWLVRNMLGQRPVSTLYAEGER